VPVVYLARKKFLMATVAPGSFLAGLQGGLGKQFILRIVNGKTIISVYPAKQKKRKISEEQKLTRDKFRDASYWAKGVMRDPKLSIKYDKIAKRKALPNGYTAAVQEYMQRRK
jgi:hypothetical protein